MQRISIVQAPKGSQQRLLTNGPRLFRGHAPQDSLIWKAPDTADGLLGSSV